MRSKKILVTGGAGFIGSHLCQHLLQAGHAVICLDNLYTAPQKNIRHLLNHPLFHFIQHDITQPLSHPVVQEVDEIYNLACPASPKHYQHQPIETIKTNLIGSMNMLELAHNSKAKILQASTSEVYGDPYIHPQPESYNGNVNIIGPRACYDESKRCAETLSYRDGFTTVVNPIHSLMLEEGALDMKRLTIAIVSPGKFSVPPVVGTSVEHDINMVVQQWKKAHRVVVYTRKCKEYPGSSQDGQVKYKRVKYRGWRKYLQKVTADLKKLKPDVIQVENRPRYILHIKKKLPHTPLVLNMHSMQFASAAHIPPQKMKRVARTVDALITNSDHLQQEYVKRFPKFTNKVHAVHLGIDCTPYLQAAYEQQKLKSLRKKYGLQSKEKVLLFVGRLQRKKGVHYLLNALPQVLNKHPRLKLVIVGSSSYGTNRSTSYVQMIRKKAKRFREQVIFTRFVKPEQVKYMYQLADIVITPSVWKEPFGRVNLEAMASGRPIVTTRRGGIPEVVQDRQHGYVCSLKHLSALLPKRLNSLLQSDQKRIQWGNNGLRRAKTFTWRKTADAYLSVYEQVLST